MWAFALRMSLKKFVCFSSSLGFSSHHRGLWLTTRSIGSLCWPGAGSRPSCTICTFVWVWSEMFSCEKRTDGRDEQTAARFNTWNHRLEGRNNPKPSRWAEKVDKWTYICMSFTCTVSTLYGKLSVKCFFYRTICCTLFSFWDKISIGWTYYGTMGTNRKQALSRLRVKCCKWFPRVLQHRIPRLVFSGRSWKTSGGFAVVILILVTLHLSPSH